MDPLSAPIGKKFNVNAADYPLMTQLCRHGYTPIQYLPGGRAIVRRDFHKLLTLEEQLDQLR
jgi:hypothetical protein